MSGYHIHDPDGQRKLERMEKKQRKVEQQERNRDMNLDWILANSYLFSFSSTKCPKIGIKQNSMGSMPN